MVDSQAAAEAEQAQIEDRALYEDGNDRTWSKGNDSLLEGY